MGAESTPAAAAPESVRLSRPLQGGQDISGQATIERTSCSSPSFTHEIPNPRHSALNHAIEVYY